jgi:hypothetical protein
VRLAVRCRQLFTLHLKDEVLLICILLFLIHRKDVEHLFHVYELSCVREFVGFFDKFYVI